MEILSTSPSEGGLAESGMVYGTSVWISFAVGMVGTIVFQSMFELKYFKQVLAFLYFIVALLGSLVLTSESSLSLW